MKPKSPTEAFAEAANRKADFRGQFLTNFVALTAAPFPFAFASDNNSVTMTTPFVWPGSEEPIVIRVSHHEESTWGSPRYRVSDLGEASRRFPTIQEDIAEVAEGPAGIFHFLQTLIERGVHHAHGSRP